MATGPGITCNVNQLINRAECLGDSLVKITQNFNSTDTALCELTQEITRLAQEIQLFGGSSPSLVGIRISFDPSTPIPTEDIKNANRLYIHPYKGNIVTLWNPGTNKWDLYQIPGVLSFPLNCPNADTNYDIYLYRNGGSFNVEFVPWASSVAGGTAPTRIYQDSTIVKAGDPSKRLIGCLRTTEVNQSEQSFGTINFGGSHPKQFLWNAQNLVPVSVQNFDSGSWTYTWNNEPGYVLARRPGSTNAADNLLYASKDAQGFGIGNPYPFYTGLSWKRTHQMNDNNPDGRNNRFSFIIGEPTQVDLHYQAYQNCTSGTGLNDIVGYIGIGLNNETTPTYNGYQMIGELRGDSKTPRSVYQQTLPPGYHYLQTFDRGWQNIIWGEYHSVETGFLGTIYN